MNERIPGSITYTAHRDILSGLGTDHQILCAGHVSNKFLTDMLPYADIIDIQDYSDFKFPSYLPIMQAVEKVWDVLGETVALLN